MRPVRPAPAHAHGRCSLPGGEGDFSIDAKLNGAYILIGLLYGDGDPERTMTLALRCGQDSDCNPSSAAGILFTSLGLEAVPGRFKSALSLETRFSHSSYDFPRLIEVCEALARQAVTRSGGVVERDPEDGETLVIPAAPVRPGPLERSWDPGPAAGSVYTEAELEGVPPPE